MASNESVAFLEKALQGILMRQQAISHNIANQNTPGYRAREVKFEDTLSSALQRGDTKSVRFKIVESEGGPTRLNGNNVELEREWMNMEENRLLHELFSRALGSRFRSMVRAIRGQ
jgi:flagellar basal-body rod protein FlgB